MSNHQIQVKLNQQQVELLDRTLERFDGKDRADLVVTALREYCAAHPEVSDTR